LSAVKLNRSCKHSVWVDNSGKSFDELFEKVSFWTTFEGVTSTGKSD